MQRKVFVLFLIILASYASLGFSDSPPARIKDIAHVLEARDNPIMGFGLVVGLKNTGDSSTTEFTKQALTNMLSRMGIAPQENEFKSKNVAAVIVTGKLTPYLKPGQKIDVTVSSVGDSTSLKGGTLLITPMHGTDDDVYAVAQGALVIGQVGVEDTHSSAFMRRPSTVGRIAGGGIVEKEVPVTVTDESVTIVLDNPDFTTASRVVSSLNKSGIDALAKDAASITAKPRPIYVTRNEYVTTIEVESIATQEFSSTGELVVKMITQEVLVTKEVEIKDEIKIERVDFIAHLENATVVPDSVAKIVINEKTGIIVIGENVRIAPVAIAYEGISVTISNMKTYSRSTGGDEGLTQVDAYSEFTPKIKAAGAEEGIVQASGGATLSDLANALDAIGAKPKDLIEILQAIKAAGALNAEIEVI